MMFKNNQLYAILPHRGVALGKSRLSSVLDPAQRVALNRWLITHTLREAAHALGDARHCLLVSPCAVTLALAQTLGAHTLRDSGGGLNTALWEGVQHAAQLGATQVLIVACDLPRLGNEALQTLLALARPHTTVIAPDAQGLGTNAMLLDATVREFAFGDHSFARHTALAKARGDALQVCNHPALAFDVDTVDDYRAWRNSDARSGTVSCAL